MKGDHVSTDSYSIPYVKTLQLLFYIFNLIKRYKVYISKFETKKLKYLNYNIFESLVYANQDHNAVIFLPIKVALRLSFSSGLWVLARFFSRKLDYKQAQLRWVKIIVDYNLKKEDNCYISLILYHNLKEKLGTHDIYVEIKNEKLIYNIYLVTRLFTIWNSKRNLKSIYSTYISSLQPKFASEVSLSFVNDELKSLIKDVKDVEYILQHYFTYPRYLHIGDVLVVPIPIPDTILDDSLNYIFGPKFLYFYVASINGSNNLTNSVSGYLVCKERTTLFLSGTKNIKVPYLSYCINPLEEVVPPCLQTIFNKISTIFQSHYSIQAYSELKNANSSFKRIKEEFNIVEALDCDKVANEQFNKQCLYYHGHILLVGPTGSGKVRIIKLLAEKFSYRIKWIDCLSLKGDTSAATERKIDQVFSTIHTYTFIVLTRIGDLSEDKDGNGDPRVFMALKKHFQQLAFKLQPFIVATVEKQSSISDDLWSLFTYPLVIECPTSDERAKTLLWFICGYSHCEWGAAQNIFKDKSTLLNVISHRTAGFFIGDLEEYILRVYRHFFERAKGKRDKPKGVNYHLNEFPAKEDFLKILDELQEQRSLSLGLPRIPKVEWKDVGGLEDAKKELINTIELPIKHPNIISKSFRRSGILLYGPPGTGKTLLAKSVASECGLNFLSVKGPELLNMYIGQSEENVREVFGKAKAAAPCVLFFDEVDSLAPNRGRSGDSGGVMDRIVSALLAELDGVSASADVFVLGATNRPDLIDPALLRPGRFEKHIFLGLPETREEQIKILKAVTSKIPLEETVSLQRIADHLPLSLTGADFSALAVDAFYVATRRVIELLQKSSLHTPPDDTRVLVSEDDFFEALRGLKHSVSAAELKIYQKMKKKRALVSPS